VLRQPSAPATVCGLDIGSNTFSCVELAPGHGSLSVVRDTSIPVRLSEDLVPGGPLNPAAVKRGLDVLAQLVEQFDLRAKPLRAVATQVLRMARDPERFTDPASELIGVEIEIVEGTTEALLTSRGATLGLAGSGPWIVADVGGQSTEVCWQDAAGRWQPTSLRLGVVGLTEEHVRADPPTFEEIERMRDGVCATLSRGLPRSLPGELLAVAGTATTLGWLERGLEKWDRDAVHGMPIDRALLERWTARMNRIPSAERVARYGLGPGRADVFPAGLCVIDSLLEHLGRERFTVSVNGLRVGVALTLLEE